MNDTTRMLFITQYGNTKLLLTDIYALKRNFENPPNIYGQDIAQPLKGAYSSVKSLDEAKGHNRKGKNSQKENPRAMKKNELES